MAKGHKRYYALIIFGLFFLIIPSFNIIDVFPDCVAYLILASVVANAGSAVPYLSETKEALTKLSFITLAKIPAMFVMYSNMFSGRDIIALFTLTFNILEMLFLISAIKNGFDALYYLGSRSEASSIITRFKFMWHRTKAETVRNLSIAFFIIRAIVNTVPQFLLLTSSDEWMMFYMRRAYPYVELSGMALMLLFGLFWFAMTVKYILSIRRQRAVYNSVLEVAGTDRLSTIASRKRIKKLLNTLMILAVATVFSIDITLEEFKNVNVLPHFIYGFLLLFVAWRLFEDRRTRVLSAIGCGTYVIFGVLAHRATVNFTNNYDYDSFAMDTGSAVYKSTLEAYIPIELFSVLECLSFLFFVFVIARAFARLLRENTGLLPTSERYSQLDKQRHASLTRRGYIMFGIAGIITLCKTMNVFFKTVCTKVFVTVEGNDTLALIAEPMLPWFGVFTFILSIGLIIYSFLYIADVRTDVKMKYEDEMDW